MSSHTVPYLDLASPEFSTKSQIVLDARDQSWCARTPFGLAVLRHREAGLLLKDRRLRQGSHAWPDIIGLSGSFAEFWKRSVISIEGKAHRQVRALAIAALSDDFVEKLKPDFTHIAQELTHDLLNKQRCEFMADFSHKFSGMAICTLLNISLDQHEFVASNASDLGLAMSVEGKQYEARFNAACDRLMALASDLVQRARSGDDDGGYVARLVEQFDLHELSDEQVLLDLIVISIFGGVDTTRSQLGFAMALFIAHPEQWQLLRNNPGLAPNAVEEIIRAWPTTTWATREAIQDFVFGGMSIQQGETLHFLVHACALDPCITDDPKFDISKRRKIHFGFGGGAHHCLGHSMARTDIACALSVLAGRVQDFRYDGEPQWMPDSGNTSALSLPLRIW